MVTGGGREGGREGVGDEEAVPEEGAFEDKVDERVEEVPNEEHTGLERRSFWQDFYRGSIRASEKSKDGEEGDNGRGIDFGSRARDWWRKNG